MYEQQADMMCLVADLRELRKPQNRACFTTALESKCATSLPPMLQGGVEKEEAERWQKEHVGTSCSCPSSVAALGAGCMKFSSESTFCPDTWHQKMTNLREDAVSSYLHFLFGPESC